MKALAILTKVNKTSEEPLEYKSDKNKLNFNKIYKDIYIGIKKGLLMDTLPPKVRYIIDYPLLRIFRVIGGISVILVLSKKVTLLLYPIDRIVYVICMLHLLQFFVITIIRVIYSLKTILFNPEKFEVRNSPINPLSTLLTKTLFCIKFGCAVGLGGATLISSGIAYDHFLEGIGKQKVFMPTAAKYYNFFFNPIENLEEKMKQIELTTGIKIYSNEDVAIQEDGKDIAVSGSKILELIKEIDALNPEDKKTFFDKNIESISIKLKKNK